MPRAQWPGMWQPTMSAVGTAGAVQRTSTRSPDRTTTRSPSVHGGTLTGGIGPGGAEIGAASAECQASCERGVPDQDLWTRGRR